MTALDVLGATALAVGVFAVTNIDDVLVLMVLFISSERTGRPRPWGIVAGQYLGFTALLAASVAVYLGVVALDGALIRLLGVVPLALGLRGLWRTARRRRDDGDDGDDGDDESPPTVRSMWAVAGLTIANGADNVSVYVPAVRTLDAGRAVVTLLVFYAGVAVWIVAARGVGRSRRIARTLQRSEPWAGPLILIALGAAILLDVL